MRHPLSLSCDGVNPRHLIASVILAAAMLALPDAARAASVNFTMSGSVQPATCGLTDTDLNFDFGSVTAADLPSVGAKTAWVQRKWVSSGCHASIRNVYMRFEGSRDPDQPELIAVTGASGVGIDLQTFDNVQAVADNATPIRWNPRAAGEFYEFKARVVRTRTAMTGGTLAASVVVHLTYD